MSPDDIDHLYESILRGAYYSADQKLASFVYENKRNIESKRGKKIEINKNKFAESLCKGNKVKALRKFLENKEYGEEMRMIVHFQLLIIVASHSRIQKESVEFQMFLRENRFKQASNIQECF